MTFEDSLFFFRTISQPNEWKNIGNLILSDAYQNCKKLAGGIVAEEKEQMLFSTRIFLLITFWRYHSTFCKNGYFTETVPFRHFIGKAKMRLTGDNWQGFQQSTFYNICTFSSWLLCIYNTYLHVYHDGVKNAHFQYDIYFFQQNILRQNSVNCIEFFNAEQRLTLPPKNAFQIGLKLGKYLPALVFFCLVGWHF